jgi:hypothetical protein
MIWEYTVSYWDSLDAIKFGKKIECIKLRKKEVKKNGTKNVAASKLLENAKTLMD